MGRTPKPTEPPPPVVEFHYRVIIQRHQRNRDNYPETVMVDLDGDDLHPFTPEGLAAARAQLERWCQSSNTPTDYYFGRIVIMAPTSFELSGLPFAEAKQQKRDEWTAHQRKMARLPR